ncbi:hypothetical protein [Stappia stellulata]|uniref:hypothetical protein n=1 Tax=Stappia stellulata TaxID=71235 RepID=UPI0012EB7B31|nr:hypothetical protein [Stappia stellulata]
MTCNQSIDEIRRGILQLRSHVAWLRFMRALDRAAKANFNPAQPRIPAGHRFGGRWTDGSGPTGGPAKVILVGGRGGRRRGTRTTYTPNQSLRLQTARDRTEGIVRTLRRQDPNWKMPQSATVPNSYDGLISHYSAIRNAAQARLQELARLRAYGAGTPGRGHNNPPGGRGPGLPQPARPPLTGTISTRYGPIALAPTPGAYYYRSHPARPLGFGSELHYREFTDAAYHSLKMAGHSDARLVMFGSSVTGFSYRSGTSFDTGGNSDYDLAVVSPKLFAAALKAGAQRRAGDRTKPIGPDAKTAKWLELDMMLQTLERTTGRKVSIMIYRDWTFHPNRGPFRILP